MANLQCRYFSGYRPCTRSLVCDRSCASFTPISKRLAVVSLEALGSVLRSTCLLPPLRRLHPNSHITWITQGPAHELLRHNSLLDRVVLTQDLNSTHAASDYYDAIYVVDKSLKATSLAHCLKARRRLGFSFHHQTQAILPANPEAFRLWELGLTNLEKFFVNEKPETQLLTEAMALQFQRDPYVLELTREEKWQVAERRSEWLTGSAGLQFVVGINTGCSPSLPYKKLTVEKHIELVRALMSIPGLAVVLLGGAEDTQRNQQIQAVTRCLLSPTELGLRDGILSVAACDIVVSGDSLGMHLGIALAKWVVAWFGPTCSQEIDLYDRGVKVAAPVSCSPCWKSSCSLPKMCYDQVAVSHLVSGVRKGLEWLTSSSKQHL